MMIESDEPITETEEGGTEMSTGVIVFLCCIPLAISMIIYAVVSVRGKKKRAVKACKRDIEYWINENSRRSIYSPQLHDAIVPRHDQDVYEQALNELGIEVTELPVDVEEELQ